MTWSLDEMVCKAADEIRPWTVVNLGIGLPTRVADALDPEMPVWLQSENGILGMGPFPVEGEEDAQLINAGKQTVTLAPGASLFDSATSFAMIRGGHVDLAILGALQVGANGDLANWRVPGGRMMGIGGAMDLAAGARRVVVLTRHVAKNGAPKLVDPVSFPLTAAGVVDRVITEYGVFDAEGDGFSVVALAEGHGLAEVQALTGALLRPAAGLV
ncbi:MAG: 3-oxoacid CoA-transferase subunit B [Deltaproteobacteria bacterium]|nr:MAG: 3-oxoacid CoA-transferase subunit B [Deltaproteobacteria bacterium]